MFMISRLLHNIKFWYLLGLIGAVLLWLTQDGGSYWFAELFLYITFFFGLWLDSYYHFRERITLSRGKAVFLYFVIFLATAMVYETTLSPSLESLESFSGYHMFVSYLAFAIFNLFLIRRYHYTFKELYFAAGAASLLEGVVFNGALIVVLLSPTFFLAPLTFAYYMLVYGVIFCMPFVFIREELLWGPVETTISFWRKMLYAFILTFFGWLIWVGWIQIVDVVSR